MYAYEQAQTSQRTLGIVFVIALHVLLVWALVSGLARDLVKVVQHKVEVKLLEEPPPPPPPPPPKKIEVAQKPKSPPPVQEYVPPPVVSPPAQVSQQTITAVKADPVPPPPPTPEPPPAPPKPKAVGPIKASGVCSVTPNPEYPAKALQDEITGQVTVRFKVSNSGKFNSVVGMSYSGIDGEYRSGFQKEITKALAGYKCDADLDDAILEKIFVFKLD